MMEGGLWKVPHAVVEGVGGHVVAAKAIGAADDDLELVVEALDGARGHGPAGAEPVEDEVLLLLEGAGDLGDRLDARGLGGAALRALGAAAAAAGRGRFAAAADPPR